MATAGVNRVMLWTDLEGRDLLGRWSLTRLVRPEGRTAWFEATDAHGALLIIAITEALNDEDELLDRLRAAGQIRHPNVVGIREALVSQIDDTPVVLAVMERTEEVLGDVLRERALTIPEARQVLDSLLAALTAIHARGLVHGRMEAASVLAIGETIKLRSDCLLPARSSFEAGAGENVRALGRIVTQAVTRRLPAGENDPLLQLLPDPMARAVRRALSGNATCAEVAALMGTRITLPPVTGRAKPKLSAMPPLDGEKPAAAAIGHAKLMVAESPTLPASGAPRVVPMRPAEDTGPTADSTFTDLPLFSSREPMNSPSANATDPMTGIGKPERGQHPGKHFVIAAALLLLLATAYVLYGVLHRRSAARKSPPVAAQTQTSASAGRILSGGKADAAVVAPRAATSAEPRQGWRVVAYTCATLTEARQKEQLIANQYRELRPSVFEPKDRHLYLVTLGGEMDRADAIRLRAQAIQMGLPKDTYARDYH